MKLQYIIGTNNGCTLVYDDLEEISARTPHYEVNRLCEQYLKTYEGIKSATRKTLHIKSLVPIYIHQDLVLIPLQTARNYDTVWINIAEVRYFSQNYLFFHGGKAVSITKTRWNTIYSKYEKVATYLEKSSML